MRPPRPTSIFVPLLLASISTALQVSPSSPCSMQCINNINDNPTDPNNSNTSGSDLTCKDADYSSTTAGQKFKSCINCLQNSTYSGSGENDQAWFVYNLRYTVDWCLYGYPGNSATVGGPCLTAAACGPLALALESGGLNPANGSTYDYCSADGGNFMGDTLGQCINCIHGLPDNGYLSNFIVALEAGCRQKPTIGTLIGLNDTVFSATQITITNPVAPIATNASSGSASSLSLSTGAKIGIIVGSIVAVLILVGIGFVCWKKRKTRKALTSNYDPRFGALDITSPNHGGYINPTYQTSPTTQTFVKYNPRDYVESEISPGKESKLYSPSTAEISPSIPGSQPSSPPYGRTSIPVHQAYLPNPRQSIQSTLNGLSSSGHDRISSTGAGSLSQRSPGLANGGQGLPPSPRSGGGPPGSSSASTPPMPRQGIIAVPSRKPSKGNARDREEGLALRYQQQATQIPLPPPPPLPSQAYVPPTRTAPVRTWTPDSESGVDVEQWPGSM